MPRIGQQSSEETKERVRENHWTKRHDESREATIETLREKRAAQIHPSLVARGVDAGMVAAAEAEGKVWCSGTCKDFVPRESFGKNGHGWCRSCYATYMRGQRSNWPLERRIKHSRRRLLDKYGVTPEWEVEKLAAQNGGCGICAGIPDGGLVGRPHRTGSLSTNFAVDHNHDTGKVRGLLCFKCNVALERLDSLPGWAEKALAYLAQYK